MAIRYAPLIAIIAILPFFPLAYFTSRNPMYCAFCHKKTHEAELWRHSLVHPTSVGCIECHAETRGLMPRDFSAKPERVNHNCVRCHTLDRVRQIGEPGYRFKKNPKRVTIPHAVHLDATGNGCSTCHYNIAHGKRNPETNRPSMESCWRCHEADRRNCTKCHPAGTVSPPRMAGISEYECRTCHGTFLDKILSFEGQTYQHRKHIENGILCRNCHSTSGQHGTLLINSDDCMQCHSKKKPESHTAEWRKLHGKAAMKKEQPCHSCHENRFCDACHNIEMPHPANWSTAHASSGVASTGMCRKCHETSFCRDCHSGSASPHAAGWKASHGGVAKSSKQACSNCHQPSSCSKCHGLSMPHSAGWVTEHGAQATEKPRLCAKCHASGKVNACENCHKSKRPSWHNASFTKEHPAMAGRKPQLCALCHGRNGCADCHGTEMPHPKDWMGTHGSKGASFKQGSFCFNCHKIDKCRTCHSDKT
ncbi:MAG: hypothetical protein Q7T82_05750 [Armatimonadota bacterium]|nr:hypothetical protein [Armatimonadota bacterium]